jgi:hypothetical protein
MLCPAQLLRCHFAADAWQLQHTQLRVGSGMSIAPLLPAAALLPSNFHVHTHNAAP